MSKRIVSLTVPQYLHLLEQAQEIHKEKDEPIPAFHKSKLDALESCINTPFVKFGGVFLYKGFIQKASILFYLLCRNHVLVNGNKRLACLGLGYFCIINGHNFIIPPDIFYNLAKDTVLANEDEKHKTLSMIEKVIVKYLS